MLGLDIRRLVVCGAILGEGENSREDLLELKHRNR